MGSISGSGRSSGGGNGHPLQYSCRENPMDRGAWWATVHGVAKSWTRLGTQQGQRWRLERRWGKCKGNSREGGGEPEGAGLRTAWLHPGVPVTVPPGRCPEGHRGNAWFGADAWFGPLRLMLGLGLGHSAQVSGNSLHKPICFPSWRPRLVRTRAFGGGSGPEGTVGVTAYQRSTLHWTRPWGRGLLAEAGIFVASC